jgi:hypothetical protein
MRVEVLKMRCFRTIIGLNWEIVALHKENFSKHFCLLIILS